MVTIATFYRFTEFTDYESWKQPLVNSMKAQNVYGTILLAPEGINATISGSKDGVAFVLNQLQADDRFAALDVKYANDDSSPFDKQKVKLKTQRLVFVLQDKMVTKKLKI